MSLHRNWSSNVKCGWWWNNKIEQTGTIKQRESERQAEEEVGKRKNVKMQINLHSIFYREESQ